jgi:hypothetical protein
MQLYQLFLQLQDRERSRALQERQMELQERGSEIREQAAGRQQQLFDIGLQQQQKEQEGAEALAQAYLATTQTPQPTQDLEALAGAVAADEEAQAMAGVPIPRSTIASNLLTAHDQRQAQRQAMAEVLRTGGAKTLGQPAVARMLGLGPPAKPTALEAIQEELNVVTHLNPELSPEEAGKVLYEQKYGNRDVNVPGELRVFKALKEQVENGTARDSSGFTDPTTGRILNNQELLGRIAFGTGTQQDRKLQRDLQLTPQVQDDLNIAKTVALSQPNNLKAQETYGEKRLKYWREGWRFTPDGELWTNSIGSGQRLPPPTDFLGKRTGPQLVMMAGMAWDDTVELTELMSTPEVRNDLNKIPQDELDSIVEQSLSKAANTIKGMQVKYGISPSGPTTRAMIIMSEMTSQERREMAGATLTVHEVGFLRGFLPDPRDGWGTMVEKINRFAKESHEEFFHWVDYASQFSNMSSIVDAFTDYGKRGTYFDRPQPPQITGPSWQWDEE